MAGVVMAEAVQQPWHDSIRGHVSALWTAIDHTQMALYQQSQSTQDEAVERFKRRFERATDAVLILTADELYPEDEDLDDTDDDVFEAG
ncbi:MAG TPA: hypothetical protein VGI74_12310 [Streptosporangiaceae bacterium]